MLSGSFVAHPEIIPASARSASSRSREVARNFISGGGVRGADLVAFDGFAQLPAGNEVGDAAVFLDAADDDFGDQLAAAADEQLAVLENALIFADVEHHEVPFRIHHQNFAVQISAQFHELIRPDVFVQLVGEAGDGAEQDDFFAVDGLDFQAGVLEGFVKLDDLFGREVGGLVGGELVPAKPW